VKSIIRLATKDDEPFLWEMLYYAAHMDEDGEVSPQGAKENPDLLKYVNDWGRETDIGYIALEPGSNQPIGAAWIRLLTAGEKTTSYVDDDIPELAIAVLPGYLGRGVGTQLLQHLLEAAKEHYSVVALSVRATNPAIRLYERMGFVVTGEIANRVGTRSLNMVIQLS
jgi:ribosomal protein S18 acetylase RimI-like enzyme